MLRLAWILGMALLLPGIVLGAEDRATLWPKLPFRPALLRGAGTPVCDAIQHDLMASFYANAMWLNPLGAREVKFTPLPGKLADYSAATFAPYNDGKPFPVLQFNTEDGAERFGIGYYRRITPRELAEIVAHQSGPDTMPASLGMPVIDTDNAVVTADNPKPEPVPKFVLDPMVVNPAMPRFFRFGDHVYLYSPGVYYDENGGVYDLNSATDIDQVCLFKTDPGYDANFKQYEAIYKAGDFRNLYERVAPLLPHGHVCEAVGSDAYTRSFRANFRPWALETEPPDTNPKGPANFYRYISNRGLTGLERHRQFLTYRDAREHAVAALVRYYADAFGRDDAETRRLAALWLDQEVFDEARFDSDEPTYPLFNADFAAGHRAAEAAFSGDIAAIGDKPPPRGPFDETLLSDALEHPDTMRALLEKGADPNEIGASGRTALMIAARLDLKDAAGLLIDRGAKVDLGAGKAVKTIYTDGDALCLKVNPPPEDDVPGRTALSYAAELASPAMVKLLLARGADATKLDKDGHAPEFWATKRQDKGASEIQALLKAKK
jgi:hypothetical protein